MRLEIENQKLYDLLMLKIQDPESVVPVAYHSYPIGTFSDSHIARVKDYRVREEGDEALPLILFAEQIFEKVLAQLGYRRDDKVAVECQVSGFNSLVYFVFYGLECIVCTDLNTKKGGSTRYAVPVS